MSEQTQIEAFASAPGGSGRPPDPAPTENVARVPLRDLEDGQRVGGVYAVRERELRRKRNGDPWLRLSVGDATGTAEAVCWEEAEVLYALCPTGSPVFVTGVFEVSERWGAKIKLSGVRGAEAHEYEAEDLAAESDVSAEQLEGELRELLATVQSPHLRDLLEVFFGEESETWRRFRDAPAANTYHQAYRHGLLEHTLSVAQAVSAGPASSLGSPARSPSQAPSCTTSASA